MQLINSGEKIIMQGDFDLNPVQIYTNSFKEVLKQTMLNQDVVFRNQVHELHQLYRVQESLMQNFGWKECDRYNSWNPKAQSSLLPLSYSTTGYQQQNIHGFSWIAKVRSVPLISQELLKDCKGTYSKLQHRPLDLQLSADEFINHVEENLLETGNVWNCLEGPVDSKLPLSGGNSSDAKDLKLSLSIGTDNRTMGVAMRTCFTKKTYSCYQNVIDLEESVERIADRFATCSPPLGCAFLESPSKDKRKPQGSTFSDPIILTSVDKVLAHEIEVGNSSQESNECCQGQTFSGFKESHDVFPSESFSIRRQQLTSYQGGKLDLNKALLDDSSCCSDDHMLVCPSTVSSEGGSSGLNDGMQDGPCPSKFWEKEVNECSNEASNMLKKDNAVNLAPVDFKRKKKSTDIWTRNNGVISSVENLVDLESMHSPPTGISEGLGCCSRDHKNDTVELKSKLAREVTGEKSEVENALFSCADQSQNTLQDGHGNKSSASCKFYCISDNDSSSAKTKLCADTTDVSNWYLQIQLGSQVGDTLTHERCQRTSNSSDIKNSCYTEKEESAGVDVLIQEAAELLIHISSERSACDQDSHTKVGSSVTKDRKRARPQCSFDSFELIVLNLTESKVDDNSVSSKPFEVNDLETKDFGFKLKRGRRMKDFQREILPSLASLSRHEILEDINIMEGVLRSREYRRIRGKMAAQGENWSAPVRNRRTRLSNAGRRNL